jgi:hypothetical protein
VEKTYASSLNMKILTFRKEQKSSDKWGLFINKRRISLNQ